MIGGSTTEENNATQIKIHNKRKDERERNENSGDKIEAKCISKNPFDDALAIFDHVFKDIMK